MINFIQIIFANGRMLNLPRRQLEAAGLSIQLFDRTFGCPLLSLRN